MVEPKNYNNSTCSEDASSASTLEGDCELNYAPSLKGDENEKTLQDDIEIPARNSTNKGLKRPCPKEAPSLRAKVQHLFIQFVFATLMFQLPSWQHGLMPFVIVFVFDTFLGYKVQKNSTIGGSTYLGNTPQNVGPMLVIGQCLEPNNGP